MELLTNGTAVYTDAARTFGQDALLLARFCAVRPHEAACDLGTGCGVIPLCWHDEGHRGPCAAVERDADSLALLRQALNTGDIAHIAPVCADWCNLAPGAPAAADAQRGIVRLCNAPFDVIACNPPFFTAGTQSPNAARAAARHTDSRTLDDVCAAAQRLLKDGGRLCLCQRPQALPAVLRALDAAHLAPARLQPVAAAPDAEPWLCLIEARKARDSALRLLPTHIVPPGGADAVME